MTIQEAIERVDRIKANKYNDQTKIDWLNDIDKIVFKEVILKHEKPKVTEFNGYTADDMTAELLIDDSYAQVYDHWLESRIDYYNDELNKYNNSVAMYNNAYSTFVKNYRQDHAPISHDYKFGFRKGW